jgi:ssRNA-specific RNase YbeY (16S rRNA maturation enzyme)
VKSRNKPPATLGDIVISIETAARQALNPITQNRNAVGRASRPSGTTGVPPVVAPHRGAAKAKIAKRLRSLLIHGFLHLLGYDHERSASQARLMFLREHELKLALAATESRQLRMQAGR